MKRITEITKRDILDLFRNGLEINEFFDTKTVIYHYFGMTIVIRIPSIRSLGFICRLTFDTVRSNSSKPFAER